MDLVRYFSEENQPERLYRGFYKKRDLSEADDTINPEEIPVEISHMGSGKNKRRILQLERDILAEILNKQ